MVAAAAVAAAAAGEVVEVGLDAEALAACSFPSWYGRLAAGAGAGAGAGVSITARVEVLELPGEFLEWLREEGALVVPKNTDALPRLSKEEDFAEQDYERWPEEDEDGAEVRTFPEWEATVNAAIARLGGAVAPKLNWSSPKDAMWLSESGDSTRCTSAAQVFLLLKASNNVAHDLAQQPLAGPHHRLSDDTNGFVLVLREWKPIKHELEFRCFVARGMLVGISQRDINTHYAFLQQDSKLLKANMTAFYESHIAGRFQLESYTFDVYLTSTHRVRLVDFNPFGGTTNPLLFSWEELQAIRHDIDEIDEDGDDDDDDVVELRLVDEDGGGISRMGSRMAYGVPIDLVDNTEGSAIDELIKRVSSADLADET
eukprot:jgi/Chlat1/330/Chrsp1S03188